MLDQNQTKRAILCVKEKNVGKQMLCFSLFLLNTSEYYLKGNNMENSQNEELSESLIFFKESLWIKIPGRVRWIQKNVQIIEKKMIEIWKLKVADKTSFENFVDSWIVVFIILFYQNKLFMFLLVFGILKS